MLRVLRTGAFLFAGMAAGASVPAEVPVSSGAAVEGRIVDPNGMPLGGAEIRLENDARAVVATTVSASEGAFRIEAVPAPGRYQIVCVLGTRTERGPRLSLEQPGQIVTANVTLRVSRTEEVSVTAEAWTLPADISNSTAGRTAEQLHEQNLVNPEDALRYVPSTVIRKRYIGDRNALLGGRSFGTLQPSRGLVFLDGYLISNFLGRFDAPRWNMVTPEALERVDVLYGPFSAIHAGNSIGTTVVMTERTPQKLEWSASLIGYGQRFGEYDDTDEYGGGQMSAYVATRLDSGLWGALTFNHQDSTSQPMQYASVSAGANGAFPAVPAPATAVTGILYDTDPKNARRAVFGANGGAIDHTQQNSAKLRFGYLFKSGFEASALVGGWTSKTRNTNRTFLRDGSGNEVWQGAVTDGVNTFNITPASFAPSTREETHRQLGATLRTRRASGWNISLVGSDYRILDDPARQANNPDPVAGAGGAGTVTRRDGTNWSTLEGQATYTPRDGDRHSLTFGVHRNAYRLENAVNDAPDWRGAETALAQRYRGRTQVIAAYAQDAWKLRDDLKLTFGWRAEWYDTADGEQLARLGACTSGAGFTCVATGDGSFNKVVTYPTRKLTGQSPKASLAWTASSRLLLRASFGRGVRFPNVEELYNGTVTAASVTLSDPGLEAERSNAFELSAETFWTRHSLRVSLFHDDVRDAILRQSNNTVTPSVTNVSNQDRVRTSGVELAWSGRDIVVRGLSVEASAAFTRSKVVENAKDTKTEGKYWLRVPEARGNVLLAYRPDPKWMGSIGWRYSTKAYNDVYNLDTNANVFGGISAVNQLDLRLRYKPQPKIEMALGVDNLTDNHAYQHHPLPGRTFFLELRTSSR